MSNYELRSKHFGLEQGKFGLILLSQTRSIIRKWILIVLLIGFCRHVPTTPMWKWWTQVWLHFLEQYVKFSIFLKRIPQYIEIRLCEQMVWRHPTAADIKDRISVELCIPNATMKQWTQNKKYITHYYLYLGLKFKVSVSIFQICNI